MANVFGGMRGDAQPTGAPMAPAPAPTRGGPFSNLFSPDSPSPILSTIGVAMGNPSRQEIQAQELGAAQGGILGSLSQAMGKGRTPQQALLDLMQTEEGIDYFAKGGDLNTLVNYMSSATPAPAPDGVMASPGQQMLDPRDGSVMASVPTADEQNFESQVADAMLTPAEKTEVARAMLYANATGDTSQAEAATQRMVDAGAMTPGFRDMVLSGIVGFKIDSNTGASVPFDLRSMDPGMAPAPTDPGVPGFNLIDQGVPPAAVAPTAAPVQGAPAPATGGSPYAPTQSGQLAQPIADTPAMPETGDIGDIDPLDITTTDARIIRGAGWIRGMQSAAGNLVGPIVPEAGAPVVQAMRGAMDEIKTLTNQIPIRASNRLSADIKQLQKLSDFEGVTPEVYGGKLIRLYNLTESLIQQAEIVATNPKASIEAKKDAEAQIYALMTLRNGLPNPEDLKREIDLVKTESQTEGILPPKAQQAIEGLEAEVGGAVTGGKSKTKSTPLMFQSEDEVYKAVKEGKVLDGTTVIINGKERVINFEK
jgi:hypothetical protein